jgi:hypothetical protein
VKTWSVRRLKPVHGVVKSEGFRKIEKGGEGGRIDAGPELVRMQMGTRRVN